MPTEKRVDGALAEIHEQVEVVGDVVSDVIEEPRGDEDDPYEVYLLVEGDESLYYIFLTTEYEAGGIVYPFDITKNLGRKLTVGQIETVVEDDIEWEELDGEQKEEYVVQAGQYLLENSDAADIRRFTFHISLYASTSQNGVDVITSDTGMPMRFQTTRHIFPYTEDVSIQYLHDRVCEAVYPGKRAKLYVEYVTVVDTSGDPEDWGVTLLF